MANIDTSAIEGFDGMSDAEKVTALLGYQIPDPVDPTEYVQKGAFDTKASEASGLARQLRAKTTEAETATAELATTKAALESLQRAYYVASKGLTGDEAEFIVYKAGKMVDDKTTFEQAVDSLTAEGKKPKFDWSGHVGSGDNKPNHNDTMNTLIRNALK